MFFQIFDSIIFSAEICEFQIDDFTLDFELVIHPSTRTILPPEYDVGGANQDPDFHGNDFTKQSDKVL